MCSWCIVYDCTGSVNSETAKWIHFKLNSTESSIGMSPPNLRGTDLIPQKVPRIRLFTLLSVLKSAITIRSSSQKFPEFGDCNAPTSLRNNHCI